MTNTLLFEHLQRLPPEMFKSFETFLQSPYCNAYPHPDLQVKLVRHLLKPRKAIATARQSMTALCESVFGTADIPAGKLDKLLHATLNALKDFLAEEQRKKGEPPSYNDLWLASWYRESGWSQKFERKIEEIKTSLDQAAQRDETWVKTRAQFEYERVHYMVHQPISPAELSLGDAMDAVDQAWLFSRLPYLMAMLHATYLDNNLDVKPFVEWFLPLLPVFEEKFADHNPALQTYFLSIRLATADNSENGDRFLQALLHQLETFAALFPRDILIALEHHCLHYCHRQAYLGRNMAPQVFRIYQNQANQNRLLINGVIHATPFTSIVVAGLRTGNDAWVEQFIRQFHPFLAPYESPEAVAKLCTARLHFFRRQFHQALDFITPYHEHPTLKIFARAFELQVLYELDALTLDTRLEAFKVFLFREKDMAKEKKETYTRFVNILLQLRSAANRYDPKRRAKLAQKVRQAPSIAERDWLLEKLTID